MTTPDRISALLALAERLSSDADTADLQNLADHHSNQFDTNAEGEDQDHHLRHLLAAELLLAHLAPPERPEDSFDAQARHLTESR